jgi:hypothetical protein
MVVLITQIGVMAYWGARRQGAHKDEINTFYQTNGDELLRMYTAKGFLDKWMPTSAFRDGITLKAQNRFDFITTYEKSAKNSAHPPLYFLTYHFAVSLFPGQFSFWPGIGLNTLYFIGCSLFLFHISRLFIKDNWMSLIPCLFWGFSAAAINGVTYIRMYMMLTFMCVGFTYFIARLIISGFSARRLAGAAVFTLLGSLTQYYFLIYAFFLSAFYFFLLIHRRDIMNLIKFTMAMALSLLISVFCNPLVLKNILTDDRGVEAMENAVNNAAFSKSLSVYSNIISDSLLNSHMIEILSALSLVSVVVILIRCGIITKRGSVTFFNTLKDIFRPADEGQGRFFVWCACVVTSIVYTVVIARISPFLQERYILCVMPMLVLSLAAALEFIRARLHINRMAYSAVALGLAVVLCFVSMPGQLNHLYRFKSKHNKMISEYSELPLIVVLEKNKKDDLSKIHMDIVAQDTLVYVTTGEQLGMSESENHIPNTGDGAIVYVTRKLDQEKALADAARAACLTQSEKLFSHHGFNTYRLYN